MLYIRKRPMYQLMALYMFITPFFLNFLQDLLHVPGVIKYTIDFAWIASLLFMIFAKNHGIYKKILPIFLCVIVYFLYVSIVYVFEYQSTFYFLWGIRNNLRYYIAFIAFVYFLDKDDINLCFKLIDILFYIHIIVTFVQFFFLGYKWDYLGGIFGVELGCNGNSMILLLVVCTKSLLMFMHEKEGLTSCLAKCGIALLIAVMSELKFFFVIFIIIVALAVILTKFSFKKMLLIVIMMFAVMLAGRIFIVIWGQEGALTFDRIIELITTTNYSSTKDLGRFTAIPVISDTILTDVPHKLFGLGLGNCDTSSFEICNTTFYQTHSHLNYNWFSSAFAFLETGYIGLFLSILFFVIVCVCAIGLKKRETEKQLHADLSIVMSVMCVCLFFYNSSLRTDIAYIVYFMLALPFVSNSSKSVFEGAQIH